MNAMIADLPTKSDVSEAPRPTVPAERRRYARYQIELAGQVELSGETRRACTVRDYCDGGLLLQLVDAAVDEIEVTVDQRVKLYVKLLTGSGTQPLVVSGRLAWVRGHHLGIAFRKPSAALVMALKAHDRLARERRLSLAKPSAPRGALALTRLHEITQDALPGLLQELLRQTSADLLEIADTATSSSEQQQIFGDMAALQGLARSGPFIRSILNRNREGPSNGATEDAPQGELTLVEPQDFECWLEASRVATLLAHRFGPELSRVGSKLAIVRDCAGSGQPIIQFEPQYFTDILKDVAKELELGPTTRRTLFDRAAEILEDRLARLYQDLDGALDALLDEPQTGASARLAAIGGGQRPGAQGGDAQRDSLPGPIPRLPDRAGSSRGEADSAQSSPGQAAAAGACSAGPERSGRCTAGGAPRAPNSARRETLARELLSRVGEALDCAERPPAWLGEIEGALVREATRDRGFFQESGHPLRTIVDALGHLQLFRGPADARGKPDPLEQRIAELIAPLRAGEVGPSALRSIAESVAELGHEMSRLYQRRVERVVEVSEGRDWARRARTAVATELNRRYAGALVPELALELLDVGWRAVLERGWLGSASEPDRYQAQLALLDGLVGRLGGRAFDAAAVEATPAVLFERIKSELARAAFDPFRRTEIETRLGRELLDPAGPASKLIEMPTLAIDQEEAKNDDPPEGVSVEEWEESLRRCAAIRVGDQLHLLDEPPGRQDLRVAWIRDDREILALVDHRGLKSRDLSLRELALGLHGQRIRLHAIDGRPISDRAVDGMLERMGRGLAQRSIDESLSGLPARRQFHDALGSVLAAAGTGSAAGILALIDIDHFRLVNDIHGYDTGDRLLRALADLLRKTGEAHLLGHLGADRFGAWLVDADLEEGGLWAARLCEMVRALPFEWPGHALSLSLSVGLVGSDDAKGDLSALLQAAESALRAAKMAGGDQVYTYSGDDPDIARQKESVQRIMEVDRALDAGQLHLRCQPIVPVVEGLDLTPHYEVLLGVKGTSDALLPVAELIEAAEKYHRMRAIDRWVTKAVIEWIACHRRQMIELHGFAVNLSGQTVSDPGFVDFVRRELDRAEIDPSWLSFEVTETAAIADLSRGAGIIGELRGMGCKVALDDFGSGLASYSYLRGLPVDWLKIDGVFVRKIAADQNDLAVVRSINEIGHFLGKRTIAEYVTDAHVLDLVTEIGVDYAQGYGISPPLLMDELVSPPHADPEQQGPVAGRGGGR